MKDMIVWSFKYLGYQGGNYLWRVT